MVDNQLALLSNDNPGTSLCQAVIASVLKLLPALDKKKATDLVYSRIDIVDGDFVGRRKKNAREPWSPALLSSMRTNLAKHGVAGSRFVDLKDHVTRTKAQVHRKMWDWVRECGVR